eukprot:6735060-Pyramimonas_sp.AAC.1
MAEARVQPVPCVFCNVPTTASVKTLTGELNSPAAEWLNKGAMPVRSPTSAQWRALFSSVNIRAQESNSPVAERPNKGSMDNPRLGHFFGVRNYLGGELRNSPVAEQLNKGLTALWSATCVVTTGLERCRMSPGEGPHRTSVAIPGTPAPSTWPPFTSTYMGPRLRRRHRDQSTERKEYIPGEGTNQWRGKSIYPERGPINGEERVYTRRGDQSTERKEYTLGEGTNQMRGKNGERPPPWTGDPRWGSLPAGRRPGGTN